jgi:hypothetical protein
MALVAAMVLGGASTIPWRAASADNVTQAGDSLRTAWDQNEPALTPANVGASDFGQQFSTTVTGSVYAQPLVIGNTVIVTTEAAMAYSINGATGAINWSRSFGPASTSIGCGDLTPNLGSTSTPVYDPATGTVYMTTKLDDGPDTNHPHWYLQAIGIADGTEKAGFPVTIQGTPVNDPTWTFDPYTQNQRPGLLLANGVVYTAFGSICDFHPWKGIVAAISTTGTPAMKSLWSAEVGSGDGGGIWQSGGGLVTDGNDSAGNPRIFFATGNGISPPAGSGSSQPGTLGDSVVRIGLNSSGQLATNDFFAPSNADTLNLYNQDLGSGAPMGLPDSFGTASHPHLLVQIGKDGRVFLLDRDHLGGRSQGPGVTDAVVQTLGPFGGVWGHPAAYGGEGGWVYHTENQAPNNTGDPVNGPGGPLRALQRTVTSGGVTQLAAVGTSSETFAYSSGSPVVSSSGTTAGSAVVWVISCDGPTGTNGQLRAYNAVPVSGHLSLIGSWSIGIASKFSSPTTSAGRVYVGTRDGHLLALGRPTTTVLSGQPVDFGLNPVGTTANRVAHLVASANVTVQSASTLAPFAASNSGLPVTLTSGGSVDIPVSFTPTSAGPASGALTVNTDKGFVKVDLHGVGTSPGLASAPPALDFGSVPTGSPPKQLTAVISNTGTAAETVSATGAPAAPFTATGLPAPGTQIPAQQSISVSVSYSPSAAGSYADAFSITSTSGTITVHLSGSAVVGNGHLTLTPLATDLGTVIIGGSGTLTFDISNTGNIPIQITTAKAPSGVFSSASPVAEGTTLNPGDVIHQAVTFAPTTPGTASAQYQLSANDGQGALFENLTGKGVVGPPMDTKVNAFSSTGTTKASVSTSKSSDLLVAFVSGDKPGPGSGQSATVSGGGLTWALAVRTNAQPGTAEIWTARASGVLSNVPITATLGTTNNMELVVIAFSGASGVGAVGGGSAGGGAPSATLTTSKANSWVFGVGFDWNAGIARTVGANQTLQDQVLQQGGTFWTQSQSAPTPASGTAVTIDDSAPTSDMWDLSIVEVLAAASTQPPPVISGIATSGITSSSVTVTWTTDQASSSQVDFGTTTAYGSSSPLDSTAVTSHSVTLSGLAPSTAYHFRVDSGNVNGVTQSTDNTFATIAGPPPTISAVATSGITSTGATVIWTTDQASSSQVDYGTSTAYGSSSPLDSTAVSSHSVTLSGLTPSTAYHFRVDSGNANGLTRSGDNTFATTAPPLNPVIDAKVSAFSSTGTVSASVSTSNSSDLLVAFVSGDQPDAVPGQTASVKGAGAKWALAQRSNGQPGTAEIWSVSPGAVLTNAPITATLGTTNNVELVVIAFSSASGVGAVGGGSGGNGAPSATLTTTRANSWVFGVGFDWIAGIARAVGPNQTLQDQVLQQGGTFWTQSQSALTPASGTAVTINDTAPTSDMWDLAIVEVLAAAPSQPPPAISAVATSGITSSGATVTWTTDQASSSQVDFGTTTAYGSSSPLDSTAVTSHSVTLSGLAPSTTYHFRVDSGNVNGVTRSTDNTFATIAGPPPVISAVATSGITSTGVTVTWTTDQGSSSQVDYGTTNAYGSSSPLDSTAVTSHSVTLSGLTPSTTYHFRVDSANANGLTRSGDNTFATSAAPLNPVIDTKVSAFSSTGTASASVSTTKASDLLVAFVSGDQPDAVPGQTATVTGGGLTWTLAGRTNTQPGTAEIWTARASGVLANAQVTAKLSTVNNTELVVIAFSSASGVGAVGGGNGGNGAPSATLTTTKANSWVFGVGFDWIAGVARTVGPNQTLQDQVLQQGGTFWTQSQTAPTPASGTAVTINDTAPTGDMWDLAIVEILAG